MRRLLLPILLLLISNYCLSQADTTRTYHPNGKLKTVEPKVNGKIEGIAETYYENGQLESVQTWSNDSLNGTYKVYHKSGGKLSYECFYIKNKLNGIEKTYYESGKIKDEMPFSNDKKNGLYKQYWPDGKLKFEIPYKDDLINYVGYTGVSKSYDNDILTFETPYLNGKMHGVFKEYWKNGKPNRETLYTDGKMIRRVKEYYEDGKIKSSDDGVNKIVYYTNGNMSSLISNENQTETHKYFFENGKLNSISTYYKGKKNGIGKEYYETGILKSETGFSNGVFNFKKEYYESGKLKYEVYYENFIVVKEKEYYENGKLKWDMINGEKIYFENDGALKNSSEIIYHTNGKIYYEEPYVNGKVQGIRKQYFETGILDEENTFSNGKKNGLQKKYYENGKLWSEYNMTNDEVTGPTIEYDENGVLKK